MQMIWSTTNSLGCAVGRCGKSYFVVCRYSPVGNVVDHVVYKKGNPCTQCLGSGCDRAMGLCL
ncbi:hypothetical protein OSTOST_05162 [Ostertagia ostertagi]